MVSPVRKNCVGVESVLEILVGSDLSKIIVKNSRALILQLRGLNPGCDPRVLTPCGEANFDYPSE